MLSETLTKSKGNKLKLTDHDINDTFSNYRYPIECSVCIQMYTKYLFPFSSIHLSRIIETSDGIY